MVARNKFETSLVACALQELFGRALFVAPLGFCDYMRGISSEQHYRGLPAWLSGQFELNDEETSRQ